MSHRILIAASLLYLAAANVIWIALDNRPPFWDTAYHQMGAFRILEAFEQSGIAALTSVPGLTGFYPPVYHSIVAIFYTLFGVTPDVGRFANLPATAILMFATYGIGRALLPPLTAAISAVIVAFYPLLIWVSREALIDYWLTSLVAVAIWLLFKTENFSKRVESVAFGLACGLGMLTKGPFAVFIALPALWAARKNWKNAAIAAAVAAVVGAYWYVPEWQTLEAFYLFNSSSGLIEGDPSRASWQALIFYIRAMEGYQLFLPLFLLFIAGLVRLARNFDPVWIPVLLWILSGWTGLLLMQNKDPRYTLPLLPAVALVSATLFVNRGKWLALLLPLLAFQHYLVSFGVRQLPASVVLARGLEGPVSWHWNLYTQSYHDVWGRPQRADWQIGHVLENITAAQGSNVRLGMIPDIPCFDALAFEYEILVRRLPVVVNRLWTFNETAIWNNEYILLSEGDQGFAKYYAPDLGRVNSYILEHPDSFEVIESFPLPDGEVIRLYKVNHTGS